MDVELLPLSGPLLLFPVPRSELISSGVVGLATIELLQRAQALEVARIGANTS